MNQQRGRGHITKLVLAITLLILLFTVLSYLSPWLSFPFLHHARERERVEGTLSAIQRPPNPFATGLIREQPASKEFKEIPKKIWTFWDGNDDLPWIIDAMTRGWKYYNPDFEVTVMRSNNVHKYINVPLPKNFWNPSTTKQQKANWIRLNVLTAHGGFWIDASTVLTGGLHGILERQKRLKTEAFAFYLDWFTLNPRIPVYETYFIATIPQGQWIQSWFNEYYTVFSNFKCSDDYLEYLKKVNGLDGYESIVQNINDNSYLKLTVASQRVLTTKRKLITMPDTDRAEEIPYRLLEASGYEDWEYANSLMNASEAIREQAGVPVSLVYKLRFPTRQALEGLLWNKTLVDERSIFARYVIKFGTGKHADAARKLIVPDSSVQLNSMNATSTAAVAGNMTKVLVSPAAGAKNETGIKPKPV
ncbi:hypothetical protein HDU97_004031 [Phlyctochytrium planicorne]|nr:hypothetical protein HDU97_004031 [Phlyctochytrium planicorne]